MSQRSSEGFSHVTQASPKGLSSFQGHQRLFLSIRVCVSPARSSSGPTAGESPKAAHGARANIYHFAGID